MMNRSSNLRSLLLVLLLGWTTAVSAQQAQKTLNYGFVSPNTRTDMKLQEAIAGMNSAEEAKLLKQAINLGCVVRSRIRAFRALGSWVDGAEHSVMLRVVGDEESLRYVLSRLGRDAQQKSVIYFRPNPKGAADLYTLRPRTRTKNLVALTKTLERAGIPFQTLVPLKDTTVIYIIDLEDELNSKVMAAARQLRAQVTAQAGDAGLVGHDERQKAKTEFEKEIKTYETKNPNLPPACDAQKKAKGH